MDKRRFSFFCSLGCVLLLAAGCRGGVAGSGEGKTSAPSQEELGDLERPEYPMLSLMDADPEVVDPGGQVSFGGHQALSGTLSLTTPSGVALSVEITGGTGSLLLSSEAEEGRYSGNLEMDDGAISLTSFRVATGPGVYLQSDRRFVDPAEDTLIAVTASGIPEDAVAALYLKTGEDSQEIPFTPADDGRLQPGLPVALSELLDRDLLLDGGYEGRIEVRVEPALEAGRSGQVGDSEGWQSNGFLLERCSQGGSISGDLGGAGYISAVWLDGGVSSSSIFTEDGSFSMSVGPGAVLVESFLVGDDPDSELDSTLLEVGCGESLELARVRRAKTAALSSPGIKLLHTSAGIFPSTRKENPGILPPAQASEVEPCRKALLLPVVSAEGVVNKELSRRVGIVLKTSLSSHVSQAEVYTPGDLQRLLGQVAEMQLENEEWQEQMEFVQGKADPDFLVIQRAVLLGETYAVTLAADHINPEDAGARASGQGRAGALLDRSFGPYADLAEQFSHAAICSVVKPESKVIEAGEEVQLIYQVTDLGGAGAEGGEITISAPACGELDPESGSGEGEKFETTYLAPEDEFCSEELEFEATWAGPQGTVRTLDDEAIAYISPELPDLKLYAGGAPGIGSTFNLASAITLTKDYDVQAQPASLPILTTTPGCGYLEDGWELLSNAFTADSKFASKSARSSFVVSTQSGVPSRDDLQEGEVIDHIAVKMNMRAWAYGTSSEDDNVLRGAWASAANASSPILTDTPGTLLVFEIENPGELPVIPVIAWDMKREIEEGGGHSVIVIYKVITDCKDKVNIGDLGSFAGGGAQILVISDDEDPSPPSGLKTLPEFNGERLQIVMWVNTLAAASSLKDSGEGIDIAGFGRLEFNLNFYYTQEVPSSSDGS